jgi:hypothetical protein
MSALTKRARTARATSCSPCNPRAQCHLTLRSDWLSHRHCALRTVQQEGGGTAIPLLAPLLHDTFLTCTRRSCGKQVQILNTDTKLDLTLRLGLCAVTRKCVHPRSWPSPGVGARRVTWTCAAPVASASVGAPEHDGRAGFNGTRDAAASPR